VGVSRMCNGSQKVKEGEEKAARKAKAEPSKKRHSEKEKKRQVKLHLKKNPR
jgi:hypothetical protein